MSVLRGLFLFTVVSSVLGDPSGSQLVVKPCPISDLACLKIVTKEYFKKIAEGIPENNILPITSVNLYNRLIFREANVKGLTIVLKNIVVKGFENQELRKFLLDPNLKFVELTTRSNITLNASIEVKINNNTNSGWMQTGAIMDFDSDYPYDIRAGIDGREHYVVGTEITKVSIVTGYYYKMNWDKDFIPPLFRQVNSGDFRLECEKILKTVVEKAYVRVIQNLRTAATFIPKEDFLIMPQQ